MNREQIVMLSIAGVIGVVATGLLISVGLKQEKNRLVVDAGEVEAKVEIDGVVVGNVARGTHASFEVKKGKHVVRAVHPDGSVEDANIDVPSRYYRGLFRLRGTRPIALVSVAYGHCSTYYNGGHRIVWEKKPIDRPGMILLPADPPLLALPGQVYVETLDQPFSPTMELKRSECGWLSTHLCHLDEHGEPACAGADGEHETKPPS